MDWRRPADPGECHSYLIAGSAPPTGSRHLAPKRFTWDERSSLAEAERRGAIAYRTALTALAAVTGKRPDPDDLGKEGAAEAIAQMGNEHTMQIGTGPLRALGLKGADRTDPDTPPNADLAGIGAALLRLCLLRAKLPDGGGWADLSWRPFDLPGESGGSQAGNAARSIDMEATWSADTGGADIHDVRLSDAALRVHVALAALQVASPEPMTRDQGLTSIEIPRSATLRTALRASLLAGREADEGLVMAFLRRLGLPEELP